METSIAVFRATYPSINYVFKSGKLAPFVAGRFATNVEAEIAELRHEISLGHPHLTEMSEADIAKLGILPPGGDLMAGLRAKFFAEFEEEKQRIADGLVNAPASTYVPPPVMPASSTNIAVAAGGGSGSALAAILAATKLPEAPPPQPAEVPVITDLEAMALMAGRQQD